MIPARLLRHLLGPYSAGIEGRRGVGSVKLCNTKFRLEFSGTEDDC